MHRVAGCKQAKSSSPLTSPTSQHREHDKCSHVAYNTTSRLLHNIARHNIRMGMRMASVVCPSTLPASSAPPTVPLHRPASFSR
eukprot:5310153-Pyramimonas_sp.AAC.1